MIQQLAQWLDHKLFQKEIDMERLEEQLGPWYATANPNDIIDQIREVEPGSTLTYKDVRRFIKEQR